MGSAVQECSWFADAQESRFQIANRSEMCSAVLQGGWIVYAQESCIQVTKRSQMGFPHCFVVDFLILMNRVFKLRNIQICVVLSCKVVVVLIFTNFVFKLQNVMCRTAMCSICWLSWIAFSVSKRADICITILQVGRFANIHECWFQGAKRWNMCSAAQLRVWLADSQESRFQAAKRWEMCFTVMRKLRFF